MPGTEGKADHDQSLPRKCEDGVVTTSWKGTLPSKGKDVQLPCNLPCFLLQKEEQETSAIFYKNSCIPENSKTKKTKSF